MKPRHSNMRFWFALLNILIGTIAVLLWLPVIVIDATDGISISRFIEPEEFKAMATQNWFHKPPIEVQVHQVEIEKLLNIYSSVFDLWRSHNHLISFYLLYSTIPALLLIASGVAVLTDLKKRRLLDTTDKC